MWVACIAATHSYTFLTTACFGIPYLVAAQTGLAQKVWGSLEFRPLWWHWTVKANQLLCAASGYHAARRLLQMDYPVARLVVWLCVQGFWTVLTAVAVVATTTVTAMDVVDKALADETYSIALLQIGSLVFTILEQGLYAWFGFVIWSSRGAIVSASTTAIRAA